MEADVSKYLLIRISSEPSYSIVFSPLFAAPFPNALLVVLGSSSARSSFFLFWQNLKILLEMSNKPLFFVHSECKKPNSASKVEVVSFAERGAKIFLETNVQISLSI